MSDDKYDFNLPDLPSDEELGISEEDYDLLDEDGEIRPEPPPGAEQKASPPAGEAKSKSKKADKPAKKSRAKKPKKESGPSWFARRRARRASRAAAKATADGPAAATGSTSAGGAGGGTGEATDAGRRGSRTRDTTAGPRYVGPVVLLLLLAMGWASMMDRARPSPVPANAPAEVFSSARAMADLVEIARLPHPTGSPEHARILSYLTTRFEVMDLEPEVQTTTAMWQFGDQIQSATVRNLISRIPGTESTGAVLLVSHYDSEAQSRGAGDAGAGVVSIIETVRALQQGPAPRNDLIVLLTDAEEAGLLGAKAFADQHPWIDDVAVVVNIEMRGAGGASIMFETGSENGWVVRALKEATPFATANSMSEEVYKRLPHRTDFTVFRRAGKQGLNFATVGRPSFYHQRFDSPENLDEATVQHHGEQVFSVVSSLVQADLRSMDAPDAVFFRLPVLGLVVYDDRWVIPLGMFLVLSAIGVFVLGRSRELRGRGVLAGFVLAVVCAVVTGAIGWWLYGWVQPFHPEFGSLHVGAFHREGWYMLGIVAAALAVVTLLLALARRWFSTAELTLGAILPMLVGAVAATIWLPQAAMNLQWPVLAALLGVLVLILARGNPTGWVATAFAAVLAVPVVALLVFMTEGLWLAMNLSLAPVLGGLIGASMMLILPALEVVRRPRWWWAPAAGTLAAVAFVGVGILQARPAPDRPAPSTLLYAFDRETGAAQWVTSLDTTPDHPGVAWVAERATAFGAVDALSAFQLGATVDPKSSSEEFRVAPAEPVLAAQPTVSVVSDSVADRERIVTVAITSNIVAEQLALELPSGAPLSAVNGVAVPTRDFAGEPVEGAPTTMAHWGATAGGLALSFQVVGGAPGLEFTLVEHLLRPQELLGDDVFRRPPDLTPDIRRFSDRVMVRTPVRLQLGEVGGVMVVPGLGVEDSTTEAGGPSAVGDQPGDDIDGTRADSVGAVADSVGTLPDSAAAGPAPVAVPDSVEAPAPAPDSVAVPASAPASDSTSADSVQTEPDTTAAIPGVAGSPPDSTGARPDSMGVEPG